MLIVKVHLIQPSQDFQPGILSWFISLFLYICQIIAVLSTTLPPLKGKSSLKISSSNPLNRAVGVIEFDTRGWWQRHREKPLVWLLPAVLAVLQGYCRRPGLEVLVLGGASMAESTSSKRASHCAHLAGLQSSPSNTLSPVTASCHAGKGRSRVLNQLPGERMHQSLYSSRPWIILKWYFDIRTGRKGGGFGRAQVTHTVPTAGRDALANTLPRAGPFHGALPALSALPSRVPRAGHRQVMKHPWQQQVPVDQIHCNYLRIIF